MVGRGLAGGLGLAVVLQEEPGRRDTARDPEEEFKAASQSVSLIVFPELSLTGYTCADLFHQKMLLDASIDGIIEIKNSTRHLPIISVVGAPIQINNAVYNCAVVIGNDRILGIVPKTFLPNYNEFYEKRWFSSSS